ncbi:MAG: leucine-rich repeat domain-containing protein [Aureispira sp.]
MALSAEEIKHLSNLLLSTNNSNTKLAFELLEVHPLPQTLLTEVFVVYKLEEEEAVRKKAAFFLRRYAIPQLSLLMNSNLQLGHRNGLAPTEQTIKKNIERYVAMSAGYLDSAKMGLAMYNKYQVGLKYLLDTLPAKARKRLLRSFVVGTTFKLNHCALTKIPTDLYEWKELTVIDLSHNKIKTIPKRIATFQHLKSLNISHNNITKLSEGLQALSYLKNLDISNNKFKVFPSVLSKLQQLEELNISRLNHLLLGEYIAVPSSFSQLQNIKKLRLSDSYTGYSQGLPVNYSGFPNFKQIQSTTGAALDLNPLVLAETAYRQNGGSEGLLYLFANSTDESLQKQLLEDQFYNFTHKRLDLKSTMLLKLPQILQHYVIMDLNLRGCYLGIEHYPLGSKNTHSNWALLNQTAVDAVFESLATQIDVRIADLSRNRLRHLPTALFNWTTLRSLDLSHNALVDLAEQIEALQQLELLDLQHNKLTNLPKDLGKLQQLRWLDLSKNSLSHIPAVLGTLSKLEELHFVNALQQPLLSSHPLAIPESWRGLQSLKSIHFYDDGLQQEETANAYKKRLEELLPEDCVIHLSYD